eukprot:4170564-Amphidinium_carterae.1
MVPHFNAGNLLGVLSSCRGAHCECECLAATTDTFPLLLQLLMGQDPKHSSLALKGCINFGFGFVSSLDEAAKKQQQ